MNLLPPGQSLLLSSSTLLSHCRYILSHASPLLSYPLPHTSPVRSCSLTSASLRPAVPLLNPVTLAERRRQLAADDAAAVSRAAEAWLVSEDGRGDRR